jgi:hypothetical protein
MQVNCFVDVPKAFEQKAKYTLEMLLFPLGLTPVWTPESISSIKYQVSDNDSPLPVRSSTEVSIIHYSFTIDFFDGKLPIESYYQLDPVAKCFFWLSDFQTQLLKARDKYGRLCYQDSAQAQLKLPDEPFVDVFRESLEKMLEKAQIPFKKRKFGNRTFAFCPTHDIDHVQKYTFKRLIFDWRHSFGNKLRREDWKKERNAAFNPEDVYQAGLRFFTNFHEKHQTKATYFLKAGNKSPQDHFYRLDDAALLSAIKNQEIGLHPNFHAHQNERYFREEVHQLSQHFGKVQSVRQHYLRYQPNITPNLWENHGFFIDSTLSFPDKTAFRNGTCFPFKLYDFAKDAPRQIWEMPLILHDTVLFNYEQRSLSDALMRSNEILQQVKRFGGICVALWHPVIYDRLEYPDALDHFTQFLLKAKQEGAFVGGLSAALALYLEG